MTCQTLYRRINHFDSNQSHTISLAAQHTLIILDSIWLFNVGAWIEAYINSITLNNSASQLWHLIQSPSKSLCHRSSFWRRFVTYAIFWLTKFSRNTLYPLAIIHMEHINVLDFDDKSERNLCFSFGYLGIIFNGTSAQLFPPREKW